MPVSRLLLILFALPLPLARMGAEVPAFSHTEARHTHSLALTPDGQHLLAMHSEDARLSVFDISNSERETPLLVAEIPVGLEPVAVRARTANEVWVVNELSDSISVLSLSTRAPLATIATGDEPADVVFANGLAFVSCSQARLIQVFEPASRQLVAEIPLQGAAPRALSVSADGLRVYAAFLHSGNGTTILPKNSAPAQPAPTNPELPAAPRTSLIVTADDPRVPSTILDHDIAEIDAVDLLVMRYFGGTGTSLFDAQPRPGHDELWVANTEARNLTRFEPQLRGHVVDNRLSRLNTVDGSVQVHDLNANALAQPTALVFEPDGGALWVAAYNSDFVAHVSAVTGTVLRRIDLRPPSSDSSQMRGPRALALDAECERLYVLNRLAGSIGVIDTARGELLSETPLASYYPMPEPLREGRGFLYDARLSGNGTVSCASCHIDGDTDDLAWDLGDPGGEMQTVMGEDLLERAPGLKARVMHPMKGPMRTQTLRGMRGNAPFHWRGDKAELSEFNATFDKLMGGSEISAEDFALLSAYLFSLKHHPNPNRGLENQPAAVIEGGNALLGEQIFHLENKSCFACHSTPPDTNNNIDSPIIIGSSQPLKASPLGTVYQRRRFDPRAGKMNVSGFGMSHDGSGFDLPIVHDFILDNFNNLQEIYDLRAFVLSFPTGTAPAVGASVTLTGTTTSEKLARISLLEAQAAAGACDLVVRGVLRGQSRSFLYEPGAMRYQADASTPLLTRAELLAQLNPGDGLTWLGTWPGEGLRLGGDRDLNGVPDEEEARPYPQLTHVSGGWRLTWSPVAEGWVPEASPDLAKGVWKPVTTAPEFLPNTSDQWFYRLRRTW